jgi:hypothetical protein
MNREVQMASKHMEHSLVDQGNANQDHTIH